MKTRLRALQDAAGLLASNQEAMMTAILELDQRLTVLEPPRVMDAGGGSQAEGPEATP